MIFTGMLCILLFLCTLLYFVSRTAKDAQETVKNEFEFVELRNTYLIVYLLAVAGDWLQGPYVYALYESYGMSKHQIEILFIVGFGSSLIFGTLVGSLADKYGRKTNCFLYGILSIFSCLTKHFGNFWILLIGRILGGIATSILFSAFESWLIFEHNKRFLSNQQLSTLFSTAVLGNSLVAIFSGFIAQIVSNYFGYVASFDAAIFVLIIMSVILVFKWPENYGNADAAILTTFSSAYESIKHDKKVFLLGLVQSLFEGSMYTFVLEWTPTLTRAFGKSQKIPHGFIFASFMISVMIGSFIYKHLCKTSTPESFLRFVLLLSAFSLSVVVLTPFNGTFCLIAFIVFEVCVGIFWPTVGYLRGLYLPEETRATTMNFFRIPMNLLVILILSQNISIDLIFKICVLFLLSAAFAQDMFYRLILNSNPMFELKKSHSENEV